MEHPTRLLVGVAVVAVAVVALSGAFVGGCAAGVEATPPAQQQSASSSGGNGAGGAQGGQGGSGLCPTDCSAIDAPQCLKSVCNDGSYQGTIGDCVIVPEDVGVACDDGVFCTVDDACDGTGQCDGGPQNDCGMTPEACKEVTCDEASATCTQSPSMNGAPCQDPSNLCIKGSTCSN